MSKQQECEGIALLGAQLALQSRITFPWASLVSEDFFLEYVLPYANVNEARNNWRPFLLDAVNSLLLASESDVEELSTSDVFYLINNNLWSGVLGKEFRLDRENLKLL